MKRFLLFAGDSYYPSHGWKDFQSSFDTQAEAEEAGEVRRRDWWQVVDTLTGIIVAFRYEQYPIERFP